MRVDGLVIVRGERKRHQDGRLLANGQLRNGRRAGPADEQVRAGVRARHVVDERGGLSGRELLVARRDLRQIFHAGLVQQVDPRAVTQDLDRFRHAHVEHVRALRAAGDEDR